MFYLSNSLSILTFLVLLMLLVDCRKILCVVGGCVGVKTLMSKNASCLAFQNPLARTSARAPSSVLVERADMISPLSGWSDGLVATLLHTSVRREAVMSLISLCRMVGKPPLWHIMVSSASWLIGSSRRPNDVSIRLWRREAVWATYARLDRKLQIDCLLRHPVES